MSNFIKNSNKSGLIGGGLMGVGALLVFLWAVWFDNSDYGGWVDSTWIIGVILFIAGVAVIASKTGRRPS